MSEVETTTTAPEPPSRPLDSLQWFDPIIERHCLAEGRMYGSIQIDGVQYAAISDSSFIAAVRSDAPLLPAPNLADIFRFPGRSVTGVSLNLPRFQAYIASLIPPVPEKAACPACKGTGLVQCENCRGSGQVECCCSTCSDEHTYDCDECDNGKVECLTCEPPLITASTRVPFHLGKLCFNARLFWQFIGHLKGETFVFRESDHETPSFLAGDDWHVAVMPLSKGLYSDAPHYAMDDDAPRGQEPPSA